MQGGRENWKCSVDIEEKDKGKMYATCTAARVTKKSSAARGKYLLMRSMARSCAAVDRHPLLAVALSENVSDRS